MPESLYHYIWRVSQKAQFLLCALAIAVAPLSMAPLELQRRIIDDAIKADDYQLLYLLCAAYLAVIVVQGGLKYALNVYRGNVSERVIRDLRRKSYRGAFAPVPSRPEAADEGVDSGTVVSIVAAEVEHLGGFVGESLYFPVLHGGTMVAILGYMTWTQPLIALLALALYLPQMVVIPRIQHVINRHANARINLVREIGDDIVADAEAGTRRKNVPSTLDTLFGRAFALRMRIYWLKSLIKFINNSMAAMGPLGVLFVGGMLVISGHTDIGVVVAFMTGLTKLGEPWRGVVGFYRRVSDARIKYRLIRDAVGPEPSRAG